MAHHDDSGDRVAALEKLDEALSTAVNQLVIYLDLNHEPGARSSPGDLLAAVLHRYAQRHHPSSDSPLAALPEIIDEVLEAREDSDRRRAEYREEYGERAGDLLASMKDAAEPVPPRFNDRGDIGQAVGRYRAKLDRHLGEGAGLSAKQKVEKNAERNATAAHEAFFLRWRHPDRFTINTATSSLEKECVFDHVAPKYGMKPKTLYNIYHETYSPELRKRAARRKRGA